MCRLRTACGRKRSASPSAAALSSRLRALRGSAPAPIRLTSSPAASSYSPAPGESSVSTRVCIPCRPLASRCATSWMPPLAGGKSGVRISSRASPWLGCLRAIEPVEAVDPQAQRQQRPEHIAVIVGGRRMLAHEPAHGGSVEVALAVDRPPLELTLHDRCQRATQPLRRRNAKRRLAIAPEPALWHHPR